MSEEKEEKQVGYCGKRCGRLEADKKCWKCRKNNWTRLRRISYDLVWDFGIDLVMRMYLYNEWIYALLYSLIFAVTGGVFSLLKIDSFAIGFYFLALVFLLLVVKAGIMTLIKRIKKYVEKT